MENLRLSSVASFPLVDQDHAEIRLLNLLPDTVYSAPIYCTYTKTSLNRQTADYETISYAWGTGPHDQTITIDGQPVHISLIVIQVLRRLRGRAKPRTLWIDALCIDQDNLEEKGGQVQLMHHIYKKCTSCAIWLGPLGPSIAPSAAQDVYSFIQWLAGTVNRPAFLADEDRTRAAAQTLIAFMSLPWWSRIWTVQECTLPPDAAVYWGEGGDGDDDDDDALPPLPWHTIQEASDRLFDDTKPDDIIDTVQRYGFADAVNRVTTSLRGLKFSIDEDPLNLLWRWRVRYATDDRDKVYGLMGIPSPANTIPAGRACDYSLSVGDLYTRVTVELIKRHGNLKPLIGRGGERPRLDGVPTWVVDWRRATNMTDYWEKQEVWHLLSYTADRGLREMQVQSGRCFSEDGRGLCLQGLFVDRLALVEDEGDDDDDVGGIMDSVRSKRTDRWLSLVSRYEMEKGPLPGGCEQPLAGIRSGNLVPGAPDLVSGKYNWQERALDRQALFITEEGHLGIGPKLAVAGQELWAVGGSRFLMILEPVDGGLRGCKGCEKAPGYNTALEMTFHGEGYVYGMMMGEAVATSTRKPVDIRLV